MAVIGKIRGLGWKLAFIIGIVLFLFLISSELQNVNGLFNGSKTTLANINGTSISPQDFDKKINENEANFLLNKRDGNQNISEEERQQIREQTWNELKTSTIMDKVYQENGLLVTTEEKLELTQGKFAHPVMKQNFPDPATGGVNSMAVKQFVTSLDKPQEGFEPGQKRKIWTNLEKYIVDDRHNTKYTGLLSKTIYAPKWAGEMLYNDYTTTSDLSVVQLLYGSIPDKDVKIEDQDLKEYLTAHSKKYETKEESRRIKFVTFAVTPSTFDSLEVSKYMSEKFAELKTTDNDTVFINLYSESQYNGQWQRKSEMSGANIDSIFSLSVGGYAGPYYDGMAMKVAKVTNRKMLSDSVQYQQVFFSIKTQEEANAKIVIFDSLFKQLDTLGGDMTAIANAFSEDPANTQQISATEGMKLGGFKGWTTKSMVSPQLAYFLFDNNEGRYMKVQDDKGIYILKVVRDNPTVPAIKVSYLTKSIIPSKETEDGILSTVSKFANDNHDANKFELATKKISPLNTREFTLAENDYQIPGVGISRQLIRWVYEAKKFDVSTPFRVDDKYVVAMVRQIVPKGVPSVDQIKVELTSAVLKEKKAALLSKKVTAAAAKSIDLLASKLGVQVVQIPGVNFANPYVGNLSRNGEPAVVGAAAGLVKGKLSSPIVGNEGVYVLVVNDVKPVPVKDASQYKIYGSGVGQQIASRIVSGIAKAIVEKANITDNRSTFY
jgi:peptidyl-prolyl cis-trans isomerase D